MTVCLQHRSPISAAPQAGDHTSLAVDGWLPAWTPGLDLLTGGRSRSRCAGRVGIPTLANIVIAAMAIASTS
jgi:hypothetical protein